MKKHIKILLAAILALAVMSGCSEANQGAENNGDSYVNQTDAATASIILSENSVQVNGSGAEAKGTIVTIKSAGTYTVSGTLDDGSITVDAGKNDTVEIILQGAEIKCSDSSPIYSKQAKETVVTLAEGTSNILSDGESYVYESDTADEPDAALFAKDNLTVRGEGALTVEGNFNNGIGSKDDLNVESGNIKVTAANDALRGRDSVTVSGGVIKLDAGGDGIKSNNDEDAEKGWISVTGGDLSIAASNDGIQAETDVSISGGTFSIVSGGGSAASAEQTDETISMKGIKASVSVTVLGGTFNIDTADDAVHSNGSVLITGGDFEIASGDDGIHADSSTQIDSGNINITGSYEGIEGNTVDINGGNIRIVSSDDGMNAAGGSDISSGPGRFGADSFSQGSSAYIRITGGEIYVDASGDGIDSNGDLHFDGGTTVVNGPEGSGNGALDYDGTCEITGGILAAAGASGMAQAPGSSSIQNVLTVYFKSEQEAKTIINLSDENGNSLLTFEPAKKYQCVTISMPDLELNKAYTVSTGGNGGPEQSNGIYSGAYTGGTDLTRVTLSAAVSSIWEDGTKATGAGGMMRPGGGQGGRGGMKGGTALPDGMENRTPPAGTEGTAAPSGELPGNTEGQINTLIES